MRSLRLPATQVPRPPPCCRRSAAPPRPTRGAARPTVTSRRPPGATSTTGAKRARATAGDRLYARSIHRFPGSVPMPVTVVVGAQWGDEGKAKIIDLLSKEHTYVVRYQGGHNAGHTVVVDGEKYALQL